MIYANKVINIILLITYLFFSFLYRFFTLHLYCNCNEAVILKLFSMKNVLELNIGLLRNTDKQENRVIGIYNNLKKDLGEHDYRLHNGIGDWGEEKTYVARIPLHSANIELINTILEYMCIDFKQDAIAYMINGVGYMVFNPSYMGERFEFNINYFEKY